jgi:hypothetical protein
MIPCVGYYKFTTESPQGYDWPPNVRLERLAGYL